MNERIKELAEQAGGHNNISKFRGHFLPPPPDYIDPATVDLEKFAELIVRDCINVIRQEWFNENNTVPDQDARSIAIHLGAKLGIESALHAVTKQFGVEP